MRLPPARLLFPTLLFVASLAALAWAGPLFVRTIGTLGGWDVLFGSILFAPLFLAALAFWWNRGAPSETSGRSRRAMAATIACFSMLAASTFVPLARANVAMRILEASGFQLRTYPRSPAFAPKFGPLGDWTAPRGVHLVWPNIWEFPRGATGELVPFRQQEFDRSVRLLAVCRTTFLDMHGKPELDHLDSLGLLRDLEDMHIPKDLLRARSTALSRLSNLKRVEFADECSVEHLAPLTQIPNLRILVLDDFQPGAEPSKFPSFAKLEELQFKNCRGRLRFDGMGRQPELRKLVVYSGGEVDFTGLAAVAPRLRELDFFGVEAAVDLATLRDLHFLEELRSSQLKFPDSAGELPRFPKLRLLHLVNPLGLHDLQPLASSMPLLESLTIYDGISPRPRSPTLKLTPHSALARLSDLEISTWTVDPSGVQPGMFDHIAKVRLPPPLQHLQPPDKVSTTGSFTNP